MWCRALKIIGHKNKILGLRYFWENSNNILLTVKSKEGKNSSFQCLVTLRDYAEIDFARITYLRSSWARKIMLNTTYSSSDIHCFQNNWKNRQKQRKA